MTSTLLRGLILSVWVVTTLAQTATGEAETLDAQDGMQQPYSDPVRRLLESSPSVEARLVEEILERNPEVARARARVAAAEARAPQAASLPDPMAQVTWFALPPETRVGPQRLSVAVSQRFPWFGTLGLREQAALLEATAAAAELAAIRLRVATEARRLAYELAFLDEYVAIIREERDHLARHEEIARARYTSGQGLQQSVVKIQAAITRTEGRLLATVRRQEELRAALNALRDRPAYEDVSLLPLPLPDLGAVDPGSLQELARERRPEMAVARAEVARQEVLVALAAKQGRPDWNLGLSYTLVDGRRDEPGRINPPPGDGDDILALTGGVTLPVWRGKVTAAVEERLHQQRAAEERLRGLDVEIEAAIGDLASRLPLLEREWRLYHEVLLVQAEEALRSAESAYATGKLGALDLLDAEHVLFEVRTAAARTRADHAIAVSRLEGAAATPLSLPSRR